MSEGNNKKNLIQGNVNKYIQIVKAGNVIIHGPCTEVEGLISEGLKLLKARSWEMAIKVFESAKNLQPTEPDCYYYLSIALLKGRRPQWIEYSEAIAINDFLKTACTLNKSRTHYYYLWALVRSDYFLKNGFNAGEPTLENIMKKTIALPIDKNSMHELVQTLSSIEGNNVYGEIKKLCHSK